MGQQRIALSLNESPLFLIDTFVLTAPDLIQSICQMAHDVKLVVDNAGLGSMLQSVALRKGFHMFMTASLIVVQRLVPMASKNSCMSCSRAALTAQPDRTPLVKVGHNNGVGVALAD